MSEGRQALRSATLAHYAADVLRALAEFSELPIVVAHSLGALLAQRLLGRTAIRALVLLAPLPPEGMLLIGGRLMVTAPACWVWDDPQYARLQHADAQPAGATRILRSICSSRC
jgi:pimeloyl-ACP methyl ester carboxylesterase